MEPNWGFNTTTVTVEQRSESLFYYTRAANDAARQFMLPWGHQTLEEHAMIEAAP